MTESAMLRTLQGGEAWGSTHLVSRTGRVRIAGFNRCSA